MNLPQDKKLTITITLETLLLVVLALASIATRLWNLGLRVMSHDESLHVYYSWQLATGKGFAHNPMMHGPLLFEATALVNFFLGANDFTSRLVPAILGILIVVVVPLLLKPWLGRAGTLAASALLFISPYMLYYSRYIRHDVIVIAWWLLAMIAVFRYLRERKEKELILLAIALGLMFSTMEITFFYLAILASFLFLKAASRAGLSLAKIRETAEFDLLVVVSTLGAFFSSPIALLAVNPMWKRLTGAAFVELSALGLQDGSWAAGETGFRLWILFAIFAAGAVATGLWWGGLHWVKLAGVFLGITVFLFTTFFSNPDGFATGFIGSLGYWLSQQDVARGSQPPYYYGIVTSLYEYLPLIVGILTIGAYLIKRTSLPEIARNFVPFLAWWGVGIAAGLSLAGEKMPWLSVHIALPAILLSAWWIGRLIEALPVDVLNPRSLAARVAQRAALAVIAILALATVRTSFTASYVNYDYTTEYIDYARGAPAVKWTIADLLKIWELERGESGAIVAYDNEVSWPMTWYLKDFPNQSYFGSEPTRQSVEAPVVIAGSSNWNKVEAYLGDRYSRYEAIRIWWPIESYKDLTWDKIRFALTDPGMRGALWQIFWNRDYREFAALTGQTIDPPNSWPLADQMRVYIRKDLAEKTNSLALAPSQLADLPAVGTTYEGLEQPPERLAILEPELVAPRTMALGPDGSVYVADSGNHRVVKLAQDGSSLASWGSRTADGQSPPEPGTFVEPWGITVDPEGNVYVTDTWNHRIQKFDSDGNFILEWGTSGTAEGGGDRMWGPRGIAYSRERLYVTDTGNKRVSVFDVMGSYLFSFNSTGDGTLDEPVGIAAGKDGRIYVADTWNQRVTVFSPEGEFERSWRVDGWASVSVDNKPYLAVDEQDRVYITDPESYRIVVFEADGTPVATAGYYGTEEDAFSLPVGIAVGEDLGIWIADAGNHRISRFHIDLLHEGMDKQ